MRVLDLCSGAGGSALAHHYMLGHDIVGYVEIDDDCQRLLRQRIDDGLLPLAPIFGDLRAFTAEYARSYRGVADIVAAGFPCQPFSVAGSRLCEDDPRNLWPVVLECVRRVGPERVHLENVRGLLAGSAGRYFADEIVGGLADLGYRVGWTVLSAADVGAHHLRERLWISARRDSAQECRW